MAKENSSVLNNTNRTIGIAEMTAVLKAGYDQGKYDFEIIDQSQANARTVPETGYYPGEEATQLQRPKIYAVLAKDGMWSTSVAVADHDRHNQWGNYVRQFTPEEIIGTKDQHLSGDAVLALANAYSSANDQDLSKLLHNTTNNVQNLRQQTNAKTDELLKNDSALADAIAEHNKQPIPAPREYTRVNIEPNQSPNQSPGANKTDKDEKKPDYSFGQFVENNKMSMLMLLLLAMIAPVAAVAVGYTMYSSQKKKYDNCEIDIDGKTIDKNQMIQDQRTGKQISKEQAQAQGVQEQPRNKTAETTKAQEKEPTLSETLSDWRTPAKHSLKAAEAVWNIEPKSNAMKFFKLVAVPTVAIAGLVTGVAGSIAMAATKVAGNIAEGVGYISKNAFKAAGDKLLDWAKKSKVAVIVCAPLGVACKAAELGCAGVEKVGNILYEHPNPIHAAADLGWSATKGTFNAIVHPIDTFKSAVAFGKGKEVIVEPQFQKLATDKNMSAQIDEKFMDTHISSLAHNVANSKAVNSVSHGISEGAEKMANGMRAILSSDLAQSAKNKSAGLLDKVVEKVKNIAHKKTMQATI